MNKDAKPITAETNQSKLSWESVIVVAPEVVKLALEWRTLGVVTLLVRAR